MSDFGPLCPPPHSVNFFRCKSSSVAFLGHVPNSDDSHDESLTMAMYILVLQIAQTRQKYV